MPIQAGRIIEFCRKGVEMNLNIRTIEKGSGGWTANLYTEGKNRTLLKTVQGTVEAGVMITGVSLDLLVKAIWTQTKHIGDMSVTLSRSLAECVNIEATCDEDGVDIHAVTPGGEQTPQFVSGRFSAMALS